MRWLLFWITLITTVVVPPCRAQENVVQEFSGSGSATTGLFKVHDRWEARWNARQVVSVAVMAPDGTIVAGAAGVLRGSLFVPVGGQYYLKISDGTTAPPASTNAPAATPPPPASDSSSASGEPEVAWHLQIVELGTSVAAGQSLTVYTPFFMVPDSAITPVAAPPVLPPPVLTDQQAHAVVTIKGDNAAGYGFLMRSPEGTFVVTHLHLLAANPNVKIFTGSGAEIATLSLKGAVDRDLAFFTIQDNHYSYLPLSTDAAKSVAAGDQVIIPDTDQQPTLQPGKVGKVIGVSPQRLDFDNVMGPDSNGVPVISVKGGNVLAMVTAEKKVDLNEIIAKAWSSNPAPGSSGIIPYFGLRLTGVQGWETYDRARFLAETLFLEKFHEDTRSLDSYLNSKRHRPPGVGNESGPPDSRYYLKNLKLREAEDTYRQFAGGADQNQRLDAARELLFDLEGVADTDVTMLQGTNDAYSFDRTWTAEELAYRKALKKELDDLSNNLVRLDNIARSR